jgi:hypothetical protein
MVKLHAGTGIPHGHQNKGTAPKPAKIHAGMARPLGVLRGPPQPRIQGGTFGMGTLSPPYVDALVPVLPGKKRK